MDACVLLPPAAVSATAGSSADPGSSTGSGGATSGGTLFLDIVKMQQQWNGNPADMERFTTWGYRQGLGGRWTHAHVQPALAVRSGCQRPWLPGAGCRCLAGGVWA